MPPLTMKELTDLAVETLRMNKRSAVFNPISNFAASNGQSTDSAWTAFSMTDYGKSQARQLQQLQLQVQQHQMGGLYPAQPMRGKGRGRGRGRGMPAWGSDGQAAWGANPLISPNFPPPPLAAAPQRRKPAAAGAPPKIALQVCPAFSKGIPCSRGGDAKASCITTAGTVLHHLCGVCAQPSHGTNAHV